MQGGARTTWKDIGGLHAVKKMLTEIIIWPTLNPKLFQGLRSPPSGLLLFGPPGTGKSLIGKCLATESNSTFFSLSSSTFASKWFGETEMLGRTLFQCARALQPSIIFIDEVDSVFSARKDSDEGSMARLKNELLVNMCGMGTSDKDRVLVVGATNLPHKIDEAAKRRFTHRVYVPLPDKEGRKEMFRLLLAKNHNSVSEEEFEQLALQTEGYSGSDLKVICKEAAIWPVREMTKTGVNINEIADEMGMRPISKYDVERAIKIHSRSVGDTKLYEEFDEKYGTHS